jgi:hypothetical protein
VADSRVITDTITGTCEGLSAPFRFMYDSADPHAVLMDLTDLATASGDTDDTPRPWSFARTLLTDAVLVDGRFGHGDVVVEHAGAWVTISLSSPDGSCRIRFTHTAVMRFVQRTARLVPLGRESEHQAAAVDAACAQLLGGVS